MPKRKYLRKRKEKKTGTLRTVAFFVSLCLVFLIWSQKENLAHFSHLGYLGIFIVNFASSATLFFPLPGVATAFFGGAIWNPFLVGVVSGAGATLGETLGYLLGYGGRVAFSSWEKKKWFQKIEDYFHKGAFWTVFIFALIPFPLFDIIGLIAGTLNYSLWKFTMATLVGRCIRNIFIAWSGAKIL